MNRVITDIWTRKGHSIFERGLGGLIPNRIDENAWRFTYLANSLRTGFEFEANEDLLMADKEIR